MSIRKHDNAPVGESRRAPFLWISKDVFNQKWHLLSDKAVRVYVTLCAFADGYHEEGVTLTLQTFMVRNRMSKTTLWRAMNELEQMGLIRIENVFDETRTQVANRYLLID